MIDDPTISAAFAMLYTHPDFSIEEGVGMAFGSYSVPYGSLFLPAPIANYPAGRELIACIGENSTIMSVHGIRFEVILPTDELVSVPKLNLRISGDREFRECMTRPAVDITRIGDTDVFYTTDPVAIFAPVAIEDWDILSDTAKRFSENSTELFWTAQYLDGTPGRDALWVSAWSEPVSFNLTYRQASKLHTMMLYGHPPTPQYDSWETDYIFDGRVYH